MPEARITRVRFEAEAPDLDRCQSALYSMLTITCPTHLGPVLRKHVTEEVYEIHEDGYKGRLVAKIELWPNMLDDRLKALWDAGLSTYNPNPEPSTS